MAVSFNTWMTTVLAFLVLVLGLFSVSYPKKTWSRVVQLVLASAIFFSGLCILYMKIQECSVFSAIILGVSLIFLYSVIMFGSYSLGKCKERNKDKAN